MKKLWAIGDIHGEIGLLENLLKKIPTEDQLIFMGDMIDRGPNPKGVVDIVRDLVKSGRANALLGNHELFPFMPDSFDTWTYPGNGGQTTLASYGGVIPADVMKWFESLPVEAIIDDIYFCHAPYLKTENKHDKVWHYMEYQKEHKLRQGPTKFGVCGHIHRLQEGIVSPRIYRNYAFIDTGAGCSSWAPLTAFEVHSKQIIQQWPI